MLITITIIFTILLIFFKIKYSKVKKKHNPNEDEFYETLIGMVAFFIIVCIIFILVNISNIVGIIVSDKKIAMYQEENENIQNQVNQIISNYKEYEQATFSKSIENINLENTDVVVLAQLYPELKSNEMVNNQISIYQENNKKIKELKEEKINRQISKWWLYFGSID